MNLVNFLHVHGADITLADQYGATPLHYAVQMQQQPQHDENGMQVQQDSADRLTRISVLRAALARTELIDLFDKQHRSPLIWAASCGNLRTV